MMDLKSTHKDMFFFFGKFIILGAMFFFFFVALVLVTWILGYFRGFLVVFWFFFIGSGVGYFFCRDVFVVKKKEVRI